MTVIKNERDTYDVVTEDGHKIIGGFYTEEGAWHWIDKHEDAELEAEDRRRRIQSSLANR